ncbi:S-formylglutathione hydrolase FrmB [Klenkia marina]|uniref:S-formylglutathione hydrolase FrmB n=1 Tax=Klenkia marina TaxID=1960309 RepID=A0A1G4YUP6_9ACTN|nr:alpha/beta hydrolase-fold protein [Klenkia marina]SCX57085.1 S-formylglutathione hydrolase FrmB [Klenkia marina]
MFAELWRSFVALKLVSGPLYVGLLAALFVGLAVLLVAHRDRRWFTRRVPLALVAAAVLLGVAQLLLVITKPFPDGLPWLVPFWIGLGLLGTTLAVVGWSGQRWWRRVLTVVALVGVVLGAADAVNQVYQPFPTVAAALQLPPYDQVDAADVLTDTTVSTASLADWTPPADMPTTGALSEVTIPATRSGFAARPAWVYLPPAYLVQDRPALPVWVMLGGQPGSPRDWIDGGQIAQRLDAWADAHHGLAPVVVMPDDLGGEASNPLCMDSALGKADTYLAVDVPAWISANLQVDTDHADWAVGGFSYGGTCALQLATNHPDLFSTAFIASGQRAPTLGDDTTTLQATFGGDAAAFDAVDPLHLLAAHRYPDLGAYVVVGDGDHDYRPQADEVVAALKKAGASVTSTRVPGGHSWDVWGPGFQGALPWLALRTGLPS